MIWIFSLLEGVKRLIFNCRNVLGGFFTTEHWHGKENQSGPREPLVHSAFLILIRRGKGRGIASKRLRIECSSEESLSRQIAEVKIAH